MPLHRWSYNDYHHFLTYRDRLYSKAVPNVCVDVERAMLYVSSDYVKALTVHMNDQHVIIHVYIHVHTHDVSQHIYMHTYFWAGSPGIFLLTLVSSFFNFSLLSSGVMSP